MSRRHPAIPVGGATGVGSLPGTSPVDAVGWVVDALPWPHLPELPARGLHAAIAGRLAALLVELPADHDVSGWRLAPRPGRDQRRAAALLNEDLDAFEERLSATAGPLKVQVAGPATAWTLLELRSGHRALTDTGARRDIATSLAEGVAAHVAAVRRRLPGADVTLQLDEPSLPSVLAGAIPTASGWGTVRAVPVDEVVAGLSRVVAAAHDSGAAVLVHSCATDVPLEVLARADVDAVSLDLDRWDSSGDDALAQWWDDGRLLVAGVAATSGPVAAPDELAARVRSLSSRLGFARRADEVGVSPSCGLASRTPAEARRTMDALTSAAEQLARDPEGEESS